MQKRYAEHYSLMIRITVIIKKSETFRFAFYRREGKNHKILNRLFGEFSTIQHVYR